MKKSQCALWLFLIVISVFSTPILTGDGQTILGGYGDMGYFGDYGSIWDFQVSSSADGTAITMNSSSSADDNRLLLTYSLTAGTNMSNIAILSLLDADIDEGWGMYDNEYGEIIVGTGGADSWEIDEPDQMFGDIYENVSYGTLDNGLFSSLYLDAATTIDQSDVAMALGFSIDQLTAGSTLSLELMISEKELLTSEWGTILHQWDVDDPTGDQLYFASRYIITSPEPDPEQPPQTNVPEPGTVSLLAIGLAGLLTLHRRKIS